MEEEKEFYAFSLRLANHLSEKGFKAKRTEINFKKPEFKIFVFAETPALKEEVSLYTQNCRRERPGNN